VVGCFNNEQVVSPVVHLAACILYFAWLIHEWLVVDLITSKVVSLVVHLAACIFSHS
jgi:hypothetical protein